MTYSQTIKQIVIFGLSYSTMACLAAIEPSISFQGGVVESTIEGVLRVKTADFDGDGHLDVCVMNRDYDSRAFAVLYGDGTGLFTETVVTYFPKPLMQQVFEVTDLNNDGIPDIVIGVRVDRGMSVFHGDGNRQFEYQGFWGLTGDPRGLAAADLNGDGHIDLAVSCEYTHTVEIFISDGVGGYEDAVGYTGMTNPRDVLFADLDQDMDLDMVVGHNSTDGMSVRVGNGDGTFGVQIRYGNYTDPGQTTVRLVDLNHDGDLDVLTVSNYDRLIVRYGHPSSASFLGPNYIYPESGLGFLVLNDFDSNGDTDIVLRYGGSQSRVAYYNEVDGINFGEAQFSPAYPASGSQGNSMVVGDMNEDGYDDLVLGCLGKIQILFNSGPCLADISPDGQLDFFDVSEYINMFMAAHPAADFTSDGNLDFFDVSDYFSAYLAGCP